MQSYLERVLAGTAINLALVLPLLVLAFVLSRKGRSAVKPVLWFVALMLLDSASIWLMNVVKVVPDWGGWNWQGKVLEAGWPVVLAFTLPAVFGAKRMGLSLPEGERHWRTTGIACVLYAVIGVPVILLMGHHLTLGADLPSFAYEATMPGLGEEFMYRGAMLLVLNEAFGRPWKFAGIQFGWGLVIVTALFGFLHGVDAKSFGDFHIYWSGMVFPALTGLVLAWLRERTGSVWPCVLFHNFVNVCNQFLA